MEFDLGQVVGTDGRGIQSVELVSTVGKEKTYRITYTDEDYYEFTVKDGEDALNTIVTAWETTLSDSKVPSEKLTKNTLDTKVDKVTGKGLSTEDYTTSEKTKLSGIEAEANKTVVDTSLSSSSENPVQNKVVTGALNLKANSSDLATVATTGDYDDLTDKPTISSLGGDVTVEKQSSAESGYFATYHVKQGGTKVGASINIPKDFLVKSASIKTCTQDDVPVPGYVVGDKYFDFVINTKDGSVTDEHLYVLVTDLIDTYTADEVTLTVVNNEFKVKNGGIGSTQLSTGVNTSLGYADAYHNSPVSNITSSDISNWNGKIDTADIVDDLTTADPDKPLSAKQGKILKDLIDSLLPTVASVTLSTDKSVLSAYDSDSATLTATATNDESAPVSGKTVTFYKGSTVLGTATTDNSGIATLTYTATGAGDITFTAECEEILSDEVYTEDCISYDNASTNKVSNYSALQLESRAFINGLSYDTDHYVLAHNYTPYSGYTIPDTWGVTGAVEISVDFKLSSTENVCQALLGLFWDSSTPSHMTKIRGDQLFQEYILPYDDRSGAIDTVFQQNVADFTNGYYKLKMRVVNSNVDYYLYAPDGTLLSTGVGGALPENPQENPQLFFGFLSGSGRDVHLKNIKVKSLLTVSLTSDKSVLSAYDSDSATLTATVIDAHSQPVQSETVRFYKDGVSIGTATTNNQGVATLSYSATGAGELVFTASAEQVQSNNIQITDYWVYDALTVDKSRYTLTTGQGTLTYGSNGVTAYGTISQDTFWYTPDNFLPSDNYTVEVDYTDWGSGCSDFGIENLFVGIIPNQSKVELYVYTGSSASRVYNGSLTYTKGKTFKLEVTGTTTKTIKVYYDNNLLTTINNVAQTRKQFFKTYYSRSTTFKNLKIY